MLLKDEKENMLRRNGLKGNFCLFWFELLIRIAKSIKNQLTLNEAPFNIYSFSFNFDELYKILTNKINYLFL